MLIKEIQEFSEIRTKARAYFCYTISRSIVNEVSNNLDTINEGIKKIKKDISSYDAIYILDPYGKQISKNISENTSYKDKGKGKNRLTRAYYYRAVKEKRCILTNPYPSIFGGVMISTVSYPIYNEKKELLYILCIDISLQHILKMIHPSSIDSTFGYISRFVYGSFSLALFIVSILLFIKGVNTFLINLDQIEITKMFEATILLTLSLAIVDLTKAIMEEEVLGNHKRNPIKEVNTTMIRFLGSIIIALSIEALMLVFKFAMTSPDKLLYSVYLIISISVLLISLSIYLYFNKKGIKLEK